MKITLGERLAPSASGIERRMCCERSGVKDRSRRSTAWAACARLSVLLFAVARGLTRFSRVEYAF